MKFYYANNMGDSGFFSEENLVKAIYTAWNIEASLWLIKNDGSKQWVFEPWETNEFNSDLLKEFGYYMKDGEKERDIVEINTGKVIRYDWSEVNYQLP